MDIKTVTLKKKWGDHKTGTSIQVDELRAKWLVDHDFASFGKSKPLSKGN